MHIHGARMDPSGAGLYALAGAEKAAEMRRAAEVRQKLLKASGKIEGASVSDEDLLIGRWLETGNNGTEDEYRPSTPGKDPYWP